jgi:hypothetical protein
MLMQATPREAVFLELMRSSWFSLEIRSQSASVLQIRIGIRDPGWTVSLQITFSPVAV